MPTDFQQKAKHAVANIPGEIVTEDQLYVVWFVKVLQNWKALISTDVAKGRYWEVTYNGDKGETYVDEYEKQLNTVVSD